jgi:hypothetical protein
VSEAQDIALLVVICSSALGQAALPLADRVAIVVCWLLWGSGVYYIRVFDNNNKPINKASFIVQ